MNQGDKVWWLKEVRERGQVRVIRLPAILGNMTHGRVLIDVTYPDGQIVRKRVYPETIEPVERETV